MLVGFAGNCNTVASWPSHKKVRRRVCPSGSSSASWCICGCSRLICRKIAVLYRVGADAPYTAISELKGKLRAGKHADRGTGVARSSEPARAGAEIGRSKLIANARGTRFDVHQAIVAHGVGSSVPHLLRLTRGADHGSLDGAPLCRPPNTWF